MTFDENLRFGQVAESAISRWLQSRGHMVFPAYQVDHKTGKGPQLFSRDGNHVLPDMMTFGNGRTMWVEAKHKTCFTWHRLSGRWTTGIDAHHYQDYLTVANKTGVNVWLMFFHPKATPNERDVRQGCPDECPTGLFGGEISRLDTCINHRSTGYDARSAFKGHGRHGMVYWAHGDLTRIAPSEDLVAA